MLVEKSRRILLERWEEKEEEEEIKGARGEGSDQRSRQRERKKIIWTDFRERRISNKRECWEKVATHLPSSTSSSSSSSSSFPLPISSPIFVPGKSKFGREQFEERTFTPPQHFSFPFPPPSIPLHLFPLPHFALVSLRALGGGGGGGGWIKKKKFALI